MIMRAAKYVSEFVKKQQALQARVKAITVWPSSQKGFGTYIKAKHGDLNGLRYQVIS
jgi:hypothetical protein